MRRSLRSAVVLAMLVSLVSACGNDNKKKGPAPTATMVATSVIPTPTATPVPSVVDELIASGVGKYLDTATPASMTTVGAWEDYHFDPAAENAICLRGTEFRAFIRRGTTNKVVLFLEGGGACWNNQGCWVAPRAKLTSDPLFGGGILNAAVPENPIGDWNVVYVPYCDGSVFSGDNELDYGPEGTNHTYHHGAQNLSAAISLMRREFPNPDEILVSGSSAGGYGTYSGYGVVRVAYPDVPVSVLDDCGPGIQNEARVQDQMERNENWKYRQFIPASCPDCYPQTTFLSDWALQRDPTLKVALFDYQEDPILRGFLGFPEFAGFTALLLDITDQVHDRQPDRYKRFFKFNRGHTILFVDTFYDMEIDGTSLLSWTTDFLSGGPAWQDIVEAPNPFAGFRSEMYEPDSSWLCRPGMVDDQCVVNSIDATVIEPDNSNHIETYEQPATPPAIDCFYIYPTVDLSSTPGNNTDFSDISYELDPLLNQVARFTNICRVFAPLYRQGTLGSFGSPNADEIFDLAYSDVDQAFRHYMGQYNHGRRFVIMGHSQGTAMVTRLMQDYIDDDAVLRERLVAGLLIGGSVAVPEGQTVGGTFQNLPLCTTVDQTSCIIAYRSYAESRPPVNGSNVVSDDLDTACTNPAALGGGPAVFKKSYLPLHANQPTFDVAPPTDFTTLFTLYESFYSGECVKDDRNRSYLRISITPGEGDLRENMIPFNHPLFAPRLLGTHVLDYNFPLGDLLDLVAAKAAVK